MSALKPFCSTKKQACRLTASSTLGLTTTTKCSILFICILTTHLKKCRSMFSTCTPPIITSKIFLFRRTLLDSLCATKFWFLIGRSETFYTTVVVVSSKSPSKNTQSRKVTFMCKANCLGKFQECRMHCWLSPTKTSCRTSVCSKSRNSQK